jgi:hypothetical protein
MFESVTRFAAASFCLAALFAASPAVAKPIAPLEIAAQNPVKKVGKYAVELRIPEGGIFAEEAIDIEFRLTNTADNDPVLGAAGVVRAKSAAKITMPSMPGMPAQLPKIHTEGVPGDYGIECFFPHGGDYQIDLTITIPGEPKPLSVAFTVDVQDAQAAKNRKPRPKPYFIELVNAPAAKAGEPANLRFAIREAKTKKLVADFDIAHEKEFHLIMVSKDLGWFVHEHPEKQSDGTFTFTQAFPAGGEYRIFADVAPRNAGSQVLGTSLKVAGAKPTWDITLKPTPMMLEMEGVKASLDAQSKPLPIGKSAPLTFVLTDPAAGKPILDLEPYLGAYGHLMLIHQDGQTFVHSHPAEDDAGIAASKVGRVTFNARFPKTGRYKAWGQFQRGGKVLTFPFVFDVKGGQTL